MTNNAPHAPTNDAKKNPNTHLDEAVFAALDLGTNNCRLLVAKAASDIPGSGLRVLDSFSRIVRLGEGVNASGNLLPAAMERTISALHQCRKKLDKYPGAYTGFVATEACRQAKNSKAFLERVKKETGIEIDIITAEEEAQLAFKGCAAFLKPEFSHALIFDIGGGSTELMWVARPPHEKAGLFHPPKINDWLSVGKGVMNLAEKFGGPNFSDIYYNDIVAHLVEAMSPFDEKNDITAHVDMNRVQLMSTSGTVTTLAAIHLDLPRYDRAKIDGLTLDVESLRAAVRKILGMRVSERFAHPCIGQDRSDFILSGCAIFEAICEIWPIEYITIADRGVREGIIMNLIQRAEAEGNIG